MNEDQNMNPMPTEPDAPVAPAPAPAPAAGMPNEPEKSPAYGTILGIILIVVILVVGAFYVWSERLEQEQPMVNDTAMGGENNTAAGTVDVDVAVPQPQ